MTSTSPATRGPTLLHDCSICVVAHYPTQDEQEIKPFRPWYSGPCPTPPWTSSPKQPSGLQEHRRPAHPQSHRRHSGCSPATTVSGAARLASPMGWLAPDLAGSGASAALLAAAASRSARQCRAMRSRAYTASAPAVPAAVYSSARRSMRRYCRAAYAHPRWSRLLHPLHAYPSPQRGHNSCPVAP